MSEQPTQTLPPDERLQEIIAAYQSARAAGQAPAPEELLNRYPEFADQLRALFALPRASASPEGCPTLSVEPAVTPPVSPVEAATIAPPGLAGPEPTPGARSLGGYELLEEIARGAMGIVYKARHKSLQRIVALKMILAGQLASPEQVRRFHIEAEQGGSLDHPNIVPIYQVGEEDGQHYFTMKLIEGGKLSGHVPRLQHDPRATAKLMATVARAVHYAHQRGVLHRDLKPGNILLDAQEEPHVTDFGLAKHLGGTGADTQSGAIVGTPSYMAPEQAAARKHLTTAADVYSLGAVLYELLTGRPPFQADSAFDVVLQVLEKEPARPSSLNVRVNRDLETIAMACLAKEPQRRYASALALAEDLERFLAGKPIRARPVGWVERTLKLMRRRPAAAALCIVLALSAVGLTFGSWWTNIRLQAAYHLAEGARKAAEAQRQEAEEQRQLAEANAEKVRQQSELVAAGFQKRLDVVEDLLIRMDGRLANIPQLSSVRIEFLVEFLKLCEELLNERPNDSKVRRQASLVYRRIGDLWSQSREFKKGDEAYRKAQDVQERLAADYPEQLDYQNELALIYTQRAKVLQAQRQSTEAHAASRRAIEIEDRLAAQAPKDAAYRELAARYRFNLGNQFEEAGEPGKAEPIYREALASQEKLVADFPKRDTCHNDLSTTAASLALLLSDAHPAEAERLLAQMLQARRRAKQLAPNAGRYAQRLRDGYTDVDRFLKKQGKHAELSRLAADLCRDFPDSQLDSYNAGCFVADAAKVVQENRQLPEAERLRLFDDYGKRAVELVAQSFKQGNQDRDHLDKDHDLDPLRARADYQVLVAELDKRFPGRGALTPDKEYAALVRGYENDNARYEQTVRTARTVAEKKRAEEEKPHFEETAQRLLQLADKHPESPAAVEALVWILENSEPPDAGKTADATTRFREQALRMLEGAYLQKPEFANVCQHLAKKPMPDVDKLMRAAWEKHAQRDVRGLAGYALALSLAKQAERAQSQGSSGAAELARKAEQQLEQVAQEYATVPTEKGILGEAAKAKLYALRYLSVGRVAADIEGEDFDGKNFKLSDYRGKVVVLDFWANWCGFCRQMYPHERELVQRLKGQPFVLLGVNCDEDKAEVLREIKKERLEWRSWWDGGRTGGGIAKQWQIDAYPRIYVLDAKGVIRYKYEGLVRDELDEVVNQLLQERGAQTRADKE